MGPTPEPVEECEEYDTKVRECTIMLYTKMLDNDFVNKVLVPADVFSPKKVALQLQHWSIVAQFPKPAPKLVTYEACEDENNRIAVFMTAGAPANVLEHHVIGTVQVSPSQLLEFAKKHSYNRTSYSAITKNCQDWAKEFVRMISTSLEAVMAQFWTYSEKCWNVAGPVGALYAVGVDLAMKVAEGVSSSSNSLRNQNYVDYCEWAERAAAVSARSSAQSAKSFNSFSKFS